MIAFRSALFMAWFLLLTAAMAILFLPLLAVPRKATVWMARYWARATLWGLRVLAGVAERRIGDAPRGGVLVASKHMSMWDTLALYLALDDPGIVLKRELLRIPFYGWYLGKAAAIPIDRAAGADALRRMTHAAKQVLADGRPILIFPEGTRKKPGMPPDYKPGVAGLYNLLGVDCVPVALDSGRYWQGFFKYPGIISLQFLEPIPPGLKRAAFMRELEERIETATDRLLKT
ncbi:MAG TPA: lysophospholipid acyltransferase family protein [Rhizomicrobium sp.]|jgi:1-acyl-sn-glycerol-3-phosphate acyltransferase|nr:lysophospholipid acyltransferase family protein [Rhizomicrobium sp.]